MFQHGFLRVLRTRWVKAAGRADERRDAALVRHEHEHGEPPNHASGRIATRPRAAATSLARRSYDALAAAGLATKSTRRAATGRKASSAPRMRRRTRLRVTAEPTALETVTPTRVDPSRAGEAYALSVLKPAFRPRRRRNAISLVRRSRPYQRTPVPRRSDAYGLFCDARPAPYDRFWCSCAP